MATRRRPFSGKPITKPAPPPAPAPQAPVNTLPANTTTPVNTPKQFTTANGNAPQVQDNDSSSVILVISCSLGYLEVLDSSKVVISGNRTNKVTLAGSPVNINSLLNGLWYVPYLDVSGLDTIYFRTSDGSLIDTDSFTVEVVGTAPPPPAPGPAPVNTVPGSQSLNTAVGTSVTFTATNGTSITVADADSSTLTTVVSCSTGAFKINNLTGGATILNNNTGSVHLSGTAAQIINALEASQYFPSTGFTGIATITVATTDGSSTDTDSIQVIVTNSTTAPPPPPPPPSAPFYPFGSHLDLVNGKYPFGISVNDRSQASMDADLKNRYLMWRAARVYNVPTIPGAKAVKFTDADYPNTTNALTVSEGMGYGMLLAVFFEDQATFDGLLTLVRARPAYAIPTGYANANLYLMDWKLNQYGNSQDGYGGGWNAMDGDLDIAQALWMATRQWGTTGTTWNYELEAQRTTAAIKAWNMHPAGHTKGGATMDVSRTSDYMFGHYRTFGSKMNDSFWSVTAVDRCKAINERCQLVFSAANGGPACFVPDAIINSDGAMAGLPVGSNWDFAPNYVTNFRSAFGIAETVYQSGLNAYVPSPGNRLDFTPTEMHYYANAQRCAQRWGNDFIYSGDAGLKVQSNRIVNYIKSTTGGEPANTQIGYRLNGGLQGPQGGPIGMGTSWPARGMVAGFGCAAQVDPAHQAYVNACYKYMIDWFTTGYYDCELMLMAMIAMSGNWWTVPGAPQTTTLMNNVPTAQTTAINTPKNFNTANANVVSLAYSGTKAITTALTVLHGAITLPLNVGYVGASSATFTQPAGSISITAHGAVAGGANCLAAIQAAIDTAAGTSTKIVWVPAGIWHWSGGLIHVHSGVKLVGAGYVNSSLYGDDYLSCAIFLEGDSVGVKQLKLEGAPSPGRESAWSRTRITSMGATNFVIKDCWLQGAPSAGISHARSGGATGTPTSGGYIAYNTIRDTLSDGIHMTNGTTDMVVEYNDLLNIGDDGIACVSYDYDSTPVTFVTARHNVVMKLTTGLAGRNMSVVGGEDIYYYNNYIEGNERYAGIYIAQEGTPYFSRPVRRFKAELNTIKNCGDTVTGHSQIMVFSDGTFNGGEPSDDLQFIRNDMISSGSKANVNGIRYYGPQTNVRFEQNRYTGSGTATLSTGGGTTVTLNSAYSSGAIGYTPPTQGDVATVTNNGTASVTLNGTLTQVNNSLSNFTYTPTTSYTGLDTLTVNSTDGFVSDTDTVSITIGSAPPPPPPPPPEATGETVLQGYFTAGAEGTWLDPTPISNFQTLATGGVDLTSYGSQFGKWKDRSGRNRHLTESDSAARPTANNDRLGPHSSRFDPAMIAGAGGATTAMYLCVVLEESVNTYYGTWLADWLGGNAGFRLYHNADESGQATWEGAPAPLGDIAFNVGNGSNRVEARAFSMGNGGGSTAGNAPPYTVFTGARVVECWVENGTVNTRINKGNTVSKPLGATSMAAGSANITVGGWGTGSDDWTGLHEYQIIYLKNQCPTSAERDLIATWAGAKAGLSI